MEPKKDLQLLFERNIDNLQKYKNREISINLDEDFLVDDSDVIEEEGYGISVDVDIMKTMESLEQK